MDSLINFIKDDEAATIAEYALLLGLVMVAVVTVVTAFGVRINSSISNSTGYIPIT